jgi:hypothetical protein
MNVDTRKVNRIVEVRGVHEDIGRYIVRGAVTTAVGDDALLDVRMLDASHEAIADLPPWSRADSETLGWVRS